jgi:hypothetical protein
LKGVLTDFGVEVELNNVSNFGDFFFVVDENEHFVLLFDFDLLAYLGNS